MRLPSSERARWALVVLAGALVLVAAQALWLAANRRGYPLDTDEAGYMTIALRDHVALASSGLDGFWEAIQTQVPNAPLVPALTALVYTVHTGILISYAIPLGFLVLLVLATYGIAERLAGPRIGALAALVAATSTAAVDFSREFIFALPAAALLACAVYALLRSEGLRRRRWAVLMGVALGLMVLARTVTVAFLPGVALAAVVALAARGPDGRRRALANLALALVATVAVAATWYARNLGPVTDYLTSFGYGDASGHYGSDFGLLSLRRWTAVLSKASYESLPLVPLLALSAGAVAAAAMAGRRPLRARDRRATAAALLRSDAFVVGAVLVAGYLALSTSRNVGYGFTVPLVPLLVALALVPLTRLRAARARPLAIGLVAIAAFNVVALFGDASLLSRPRSVDVPGVGPVGVTNGRPPFIGALRDQVPGPPLRFAPRERAWQTTDRTLARFVLRYAAARGRQPVVAFASRHSAFNTNSLGLAAMLWSGRSIPMTQLTVDQGGDRVDAYARFLSDPAHGQPNFLVTPRSAAGDSTPHVTQARAGAAARSVGFRRVLTVQLPDGRFARVWWLQRGPPV